MAVGAPVVATPNPGANEVLERGRHGFIVPEAELGETLIALLRNAGLRREYAERGRIRAREYSWDRVAEKYEQVYESVLRRETERLVSA